jgi:phage regulator Rha-like protein
MNSQEPNFTMSSREIAHLCEKQHNNVLRDIEKMIQDIPVLRFEPRDFEATYIDTRGKSQREIHLPKDLTVTLITGYRVVKRLANWKANLDLRCFLALNSWLRR